MHALSATQIKQLEETALRQGAALKRVKQKMEEQVEKVVNTAEIATASFTMGVINGRFGGAEFLGMPMSLTGAGVAHLVGFLGVAPTHMHAFGNGFLASYLTQLGTGIGAQMAAEAKR